MKPSSLALLVPVLAATPALAHPGEHGGMTMGELIVHYAEPDHLALLALTVVVGWLAFRAGRRAEAKAQARRGETEPRP